MRSEVSVINNRRMGNSILRDSQHHHSDLARKQNLPKDRRYLVAVMVMVTLPGREQ